MLITSSATLENEFVVIPSLFSPLTDYRLKLCIVILQ